MQYPSLLAKCYSDLAVYANPAIINVNVTVAATITNSPSKLTKLISGCLIYQFALFYQRHTAFKSLVS